MATHDLSAFSLADLYLQDSDDPLVPSPDFATWRRQVSWATSLYEQSLLDGPGARAVLSVDGRAHPVLNFASYNYLALSKHPETVAAAKGALDTYGVGACGSPILSGMTDLHRRFEARLSAFLGRADTMLFNSGFGGALGMLAGTLRRGDVAVLDNKCHVSLIEGAKLSAARVELFDHNDPDFARRLSCPASGQAPGGRDRGHFLDGRRYGRPAGPRAGAARHGVGIVIDEAHSILTCGATGQGVTEHFGLDRQVALKYATLSKAFAAVGGFVSGKAQEKP